MYISSVSPLSQPNKGYNQWLWVSGFCHKNNCANKRQLLTYGTDSVEAAQLEGIADKNYNTLDTKCFRV